LETARIRYGGDTPGLPPYSPVLAEISLGGTLGSEIVAGEDGSTNPKPNTLGANLSPDTAASGTYMRVCLVGVCPLRVASTNALFPWCTGVRDGTTNIWEVTGATNV